MEIASKYNPAEVEGSGISIGWITVFLSQSQTAVKPYTIVIPPPNVTGVLHMGHMLNNTIQDILFAVPGMMGKNACWVPVRPCFDRNGGESGESFGWARNQEDRSDSRRVFAACLGMERRAWRHYLEAAS